MVSTDMDRVVALDAAAPNRPPGRIAEWDNGVRVWARTWSEIIDDCENRLRTYRDRLNHDPATEHAVDYLLRSTATRPPSSSAPRSRPRTAKR
ncbi:MAG: hypothetical protein ABIQ26_22365 [Streptosporangiaceae bacterium]